MGILAFSLPAIAQDEGSVTGIVISDSGEVLSSVTIVATRIDSKQTMSTTSNEKGLFILNNLKVEYVCNLVVSYIGFKATTISRYAIKQNGNNSILIKLSHSTNPLDEVVMIGYGNQKRETITGSISTVRAEDFNAGMITENMNNDLVVFRYADVLFMKAESLMRKNGNIATSEAVGLINDVRARSFASGDAAAKYTILALTANELLDERASEFAYEMTRREDLIRFGKFNEAWWEKPVTDAHYEVFPIPTNIKTANPALDQNPGY